MFGTCDRCGATCVRVFLANRNDETGLCAQCIGGAEGPIVRLTPATLQNAIADFTAADMRGGSVRVLTGVDASGDTWLKYDAGAGWTPPLYSLPY